MPTKPKFVEKSFEDRIQQVFAASVTYARKMGASDLALDVSKLWFLLTQERSELGHYLHKKELRRAYLGYYTPLYAAKIAILLRKMCQERHAITLERPVRVLDVGSGPLVGLMGAYIAFGELGLSIAVDKEIGAMRDGLQLFRHIAADQVPRIELRQANLTGPLPLWWPKEAPDWVILSHVLNEIGDARRDIEKRLNLVLGILQRLPDTSRLLIVEPANRIHSRSIQMLRDRLTKMKGVQILAPCTGAFSCPLLADNKSWCHADLAWNRPKECQEIEDKLGFHKNVIKTSYLCLGPKGKISNALRVISGPMQHDGMAYRYVCAREGKLELSEKTSQSQLLRRLYRGDILDRKTVEEQPIKIVKTNR